MHPGGSLRSVQKLRFGRDPVRTSSGLLLSLVFVSGCGDGPMPAEPPGLARTAAALRFVAQPDLALSGIVVEPPVTVEVLDAQGVRYASPSTRVTVSVEAGNEGVDLSGTVDVIAVNGLATFDDLRLEGAHHGVTLRASATGLEPALGAAFDVVIPFRAATIAASSSSSETCAIDLDDRAWCWGRNDQGQLGDGTTEERTQPTAVASDDRFISIDVASGYGCGVGTDAVGRCWGSNFEGRFGNGTIEGTTTPVPGATGLELVRFTLGSAHACGVAVGGAAWCWGRSNTGQRGDSTYTRSRVPTPVYDPGSFSSLSSGNHNVCGIGPEDVIYCWGSHPLGTGDREHRIVPTPTVGTMRGVDVAAGHGHICALDLEGVAFCWGFGGRLGDGSVEDRFAPVRVETELRFATISAGGLHTCALTPDGAAWCWGVNVNGETGNESSEVQHLVPVPVSGFARFVEIETGFQHTCARTAAGVVWCWGLNDHGQLGDGTHTNRNKPTLVRPQ